LVDRENRNGSTTHIKIVTRPVTSTLVSVRRDWQVSHPRKVVKVRKDSPGGRKERRRERKNTDEERVPPKRKKPSRRKSPN